MRIKDQLAVLIAAVVLPAVLVTVPATFAYFAAQTEAQADRLAERVSALRLALDSEQHHAMLAMTSIAQGLSADAAAPLVQQQLSRALGLHPKWSALELLLPDGRSIGRAARAGVPEGLGLDAATRGRVLSLQHAVISDLVSPPDGPGHYTFVAVPVDPLGETGIAVAAIEHRVWLDVLKSHSLAQGATLTLNDGQGRIIARTLNDEQWVGKQSSPAFWQRTIGKTEDRFENIGLEGQHFYSAFSRLQNSGWVLGTGVPIESMRAALLLPALLTAGALLLSLGAGVVVSVVIARRITRSLQALSALAQEQSGPPNDRPLDITEAEEVRLRLLAALNSEREARHVAAANIRQKDEFLAMLAHELRNPLNAIGSAVAAMQSSQATPEMAARAG